MQRRMFVKWISVLIIVTFFQTSVGFAEYQEKVENVIFMIPDGFSTSYATNYRIFKGDNISFDSLLVGMMKTNSANSWVTDSAAAATAMATGVKTNNRMIGVSPKGQELKTILEASKEAGKSTGLVTTVSITDATPAAFGAHVQSRKSEYDIAKQLVGKVDVLLGGGRSRFTPRSTEDENVIEIALSEGYRYMDNRKKLLNDSETGTRVLGLFAEEELTPVVDLQTDDQPSLAEMATEALRVLEKNEEGFFLMIESGQIDRAGHVHDPVWAMNEIKAFEEAVNKVLEFARQDQKTLVVIAGDHDTGGMSVGGYNEYVANIELVKEAKATGNKIASMLNKRRSNAKELVKQYSGITLTKKEEKEIKKAKKKEVAIVLNDIISKRAYVGWNTHVHSGVDVPIYAYGPASQNFRGHLDNTDLPKKIAEALEITF
ncbi:alkaline phosphatase [Alkalihalobacillus sp. MEB130]|uniref:alkaline phosphatase n=1 Tax=Alkalihalobacillus sp. MEB130 TaxID=2976704 RepID=UPI0028E08983|nr:alkaline phosphatase [Alkalihalobacillus sp. MEB130]MDT8862931.1 alkaline phosphatase [Alkalihalobacillus sp. MEB130]